EGGRQNLPSEDLPTVRVLRKGRTHAGLLRELSLGRRRVPLPRSELCSVARTVRVWKPMAEPDVNRNLVEDFYFKVWNQGDEDVARRILAPDLQFRGSTGPMKSGVDDFLGYVRLIRGVLSRYECVIEELVTEGDRTFAKMLFRGVHTGRFFGVAPTGREVGWA